MLRVQVLLTVSLIMIISGLNGQNTDASIDDLYTDYAVPDLTAFTLLGVTPNNISKPSTTKELAGDVVTVFDGKGGIKGGIAIEYSPAYTMTRKWEDSKAPVDMDFYKRRSHAKGFTMTLGTVVDSTGTNMAYGVRYTFDQGDPLRDQRLHAVINAYQKQLYEASPADQLSTVFLSGIQTAFKDALTAKFPGITAAVYTASIQTAFFGIASFTGAEYDPVQKYGSIKATLNGLTNNEFEKDKKLNQQLIDLISAHLDIVKAEIAFRSGGKMGLLTSMKEVLERYENQNWNRLSFSVGLGHLMNSPTSRWDNLNARHLSYFMNFATPFCRQNSESYLKDKKIRSQLIVALKHDVYFDVDTGAQKQELVTGARFIIGSSNVRFSVEGSFIYKSFEDSLSTETMMLVEQPATYTGRLTVGVEFKVRDGIWLEFAFGADDLTTADDLKAAMLSVANFKYAFNKERRFKI